MKNIETLIKKMIDIYVKDADVYVNNGSLWLIFTEEKKWVIELDNAGNLWYNYHFFYKIFKLISMNVVENQHYITRWVEDALQNGVNNTWKLYFKNKSLVEDALQNGVNNTDRIKWNVTKQVEDALQNGVNNTENALQQLNPSFEDALQNGVKKTTSYHSKNLYPVKVEDIIQNGVKKTLSVEEGTFTSIGFGVHVEDTIQNGVKHTSEWESESKTQVEDALQNGVKQTLSIKKYYSPWVEDALENGVKIKPALESNEGFMMGTPYVDKFFSKEDVEDTVQNGVKETRWMSDWVDNKVENTIQNGVKETLSNFISSDVCVEDIIQNGVKI